MTYLLHWHLIYEWFINEWLNYKDFQSHYNGNQFFQEMKKQNITFIS